MLPAARYGVSTTAVRFAPPCPPTKPRKPAFGKPVDPIIKIRMSPQQPTFDCTAINDAKGQPRHFALRTCNEHFRPAIPP